MQKLVDLIHAGTLNDWSNRCREAFDELYGASGGRYPVRAGQAVTLRAPEFPSGKGVPFAALIHPSNPDSGAYGGMSFVIFPVEGKPALLSMGVGTQGLSPDEEVLGRPGHARKLAAIGRWVNKTHGRGKMVAWAKQDPTRIDIDVPGNIRNLFADYKTVFERYGKVLYYLYAPGENKHETRECLAALLDLMFSERDQHPLSSAAVESKQLQVSYYRHLFPAVQSSDICDLLARKKYAILQGPPGTGKTRYALEVLGNEYKGHGAVIQFHPNTTYESFLGGLAPVHSSAQLGLSFAPKAGFLMEAAAMAQQKPTEPFLLVIDEINRADLAKVLGEAIFLLEPMAAPRSLSLPHDFGQPFGSSFTIPENLHILGTMNSSDRSIAILDIAVRRRFSYLKLWPQIDVVESNGARLMRDAFLDLQSIFVEYADEEALELMPGHSYFLESDPAKVVQALQTNLGPLLEEYLKHGYVAAFADAIRAYLQWLDSL